MYRKLTLTCGSSASLVTRSIVAIGMLVMLGCASGTQSLAQRIDDDVTGAVALTLPAGDFVLQAVERSGAGEEAWVFIEGDGRPWRAGGQVIAENPTPQKTPMLDWMLQTQGPSLYLGRPCYHQPRIEKPCNPLLWTYLRYSETVVAAMQTALSAWLQSQPQVSRVTLVGHSGGGVLALLLAERMPSAHRVIAMAAPLDIDRWADLHGYGRLVGSINPTQLNQWRGDTRRYLLFGQDDAQVPASAFQQVARDIPGARVMLLEGARHDCCTAYICALLRPGKGNDPTSIDSGMSAVLQHYSGACPGVAR